MFELHALTGGHALSSLGWALIERHGIRLALGIDPTKMLRFLCLVEEG